MKPEFWDWLIGLVGVAGILGHFVTLFAWRRLHLVAGHTTDERTLPDLPYALGGRWTGIIERTFFATAFALNIQGAIVAAMIWTTLKGQTHWNMFGNAVVSPQSKPLERWAAYVALLSSLVSIFMALIGGLLCQRSFWLWTGLR